MLPRIHSPIMFIGLMMGASLGCDSKVLRSSQGESQPRMAWSHHLSHVAHDSTLRLATTSTGEVIVAASLQHDAPIGRQTLVARRTQEADSKKAAADDVVVWKLSSRGKPLWGRRFGDVLSQSVTSVAVSGEGTIFVGGRFQGTMDWGNLSWDVPKDSHGGFVGTLDPSGTPGWGTYFDALPLAEDKKNPSIGAEVRAVVSDKDARLFVMGTYEGQFRIGGKPPIQDDPDRMGGSFFARLDPGGKLNWFRLASYGKQDTKDSSKPGFRADLEHMAASKTDVILMGTAKGKGYFSGIPMHATSTSNLLVTAWDIDGQYRWSTLFPVDGKVMQSRIAIGDDDSIYLAGLLKGALTLGKDILGGPGDTSDSTAHLFAARLDSHGKLVFAKTLATVLWDSSIGLASDGHGGFVVAATTQAGKPSDVGGGMLFSHEIDGMNGVIFAAAYDREGGHRWSRGLTTRRRNTSSDLLVGQSGRVLLAGLVNGGSCDGSCEIDQLGDVFVAAFGK